MIASSAILSLSSDVSREPVELDGVSYPLAVPRDLTFVGSRDFMRWWTRINELEAKVCTKCPTEGKGVAEPCGHRVVTRAEVKEYEDLNLAVAQLVLPDAREPLARALRKWRRSRGSEGLGAGELQSVTMLFFAGAIRSDPTKWGSRLMLPLIVAEQIKTRAAGESSPRSNATTRARSRSRG